MDQHTFLDRYQAIRPLGEGGTSQVYLARSRTGEEVVVKVLKKKVASNPKFRDCFQREMMLLTRFQHPNAVTLLEASVDPHHGPCIVMEYIRGEGLDALLQREGKLTPTRVGRLLIQICRVLQAAHNRGIIHRDLKPGNLMVVHPGTPNEKIKVMDFGLSKLTATLYIPLENLSRSGKDCAAGTPEYISPEEIRRDALDPRSDFYSLGVILFELLTGRLPFVGRLDELLDAHLGKTPPSFAQLGVPLLWRIETVVQSCLAKYPNDRPQNARELAKRFEQALGQKIITEPFEEPATVPLSMEQPGPAAAESTDPNAIRHHLEAYLPEQIAVLKLRGFVTDQGGEAIESVPGLIRVRFAERLAEPGAANQRIFSWLGLARGTRAVVVPPATFLDLHMRKNASQPNLLELTIVFRPEAGRKQAADREWHAFCERIFRELRAYLMGRG